MDVRHIGLPGLVRPVAIPVRQVRRLHELEHDRALAGGDDDREQLARALGLRRLGANPAGHDRLRRPEDHDRLRLAQRGFDDGIECLARSDMRIPPDVEAFAFERLGKLPGTADILAGVGQEDVRCGQAATLPRTEAVYLRRLFVILVQLASTGVQMPIVRNSQAGTTASASRQAWSSRSCWNVVLVDDRRTAAIGR